MLARASNGLCMLLESGPYHDSRAMSTVMSQKGKHRTWARREYVSEEEDHNLKSSTLISERNTTHFASSAQFLDRLPNSYIPLDPRHFFSTPLDDLTISLITTVNWQILPLVNFESF